MAFVPISERRQTRTTGMNGQLKIGRSSDPEDLKEYDCRNFNDAINWDNQDVTGSFSEGYKDAESGPIGHDFSAELINHVDDPIDLRDPDNLYFIEAIIDGYGTTTGYFRLNSNTSNPTMAAGHAVNLTAQGVTHFEMIGDPPVKTRIKPKFVKYVPEA